MRLGKHKGRLYLLLVSDEAISLKECHKGLSLREVRVITKRVKRIEKSYLRMMTRSQQSYLTSFDYAVHRLLRARFNIPKQVFVTLADRAGVPVDG